MQGYNLADLHSYAERRRELREDFEKLKSAKNDEEVDQMLEKYELFIEYTFRAGPWNRNF